MLLYFNKFLLTISSFCKKKSSFLNPKFDKYKIKEINKEVIILWNHRWEYDKNPEDFFNCLKQIKNENIN